MNTTNEKTPPEGSNEPVRDLVEAFLDLYPPGKAPEDVADDIKELLRLGLAPNKTLPNDPVSDGKLQRLLDAVCDAYGCFRPANYQEPGALRRQADDLINLALDRYDNAAIREAILNALERVDK